MIHYSLNTKNNLNTNFFSYLKDQYKNIRTPFLISRLEYWFSKEKFRDGFFKFMEPCSHRLYKPGDSWCETLFWGKDLFQSVFLKIGRRYKSKSDYKAALLAGDPFQGQLYLSYYDRQQNLTFYKRNHTQVNAFFQTLFSSQKTSSQKNETCAYSYLSHQKLFHKKNKNIKEHKQGEERETQKDGDRDINRGKDLHINKDEENKTEKQIQTYKKIYPNPLSCNAENPQSPINTKINTYTLSSIASFNNSSRQKDQEEGRKEKDKKINKAIKEKTYKDQTFPQNPIQNRKTPFKMEDNKENTTPKTFQNKAHGSCSVKDSLLKDSILEQPTQKLTYQEKTLSNSPKNDKRKDLSTSNLKKKDLENINLEKPPSTQHQISLQYKISPQQHQNSSPESLKEIHETMITIWIQSIGQGQIMNRKACQKKLIHAFHTFFGACLNTWKAFCTKIASSKFLMGEKGPFKIFLDWAIKPETIQRIYDNGFTFGDREINKEVEKDSESHKKARIQNMIHRVFQEDYREEKNTLIQLFLASNIPVNMVHKIKQYGINWGSFEESCFKSFLWTKFESDVALNP